jgi:hypothetical protein
MSNFEKQIKQQGEAFSIEPREQVWHRVEAELDKKKDRRIAAWWWMTPLALLLAGGIFYYTAIHKETEQKTVVSNSPQKTNKVLTPTEEANNTIKEKHETTVTKTDNTTNTATIANNIKIKNANHSGSNALSKSSWPGLTNKNKNTPESTHTNKTIHTTSVAASIAVTDAVEKKELKKGEYGQEVNKSSSTKDDNAIIQSGVTINNTPAINEINTGNKELTEVKKIPEPITVTADTTTNATTVTPDSTFLISDSLIVSTKNVAVNKASSKKITWRLQLAGGITNNTKNEFPFTNGQEKLYAADQQNNTGGGVNSSVRLPVEPNKAGVSFSVSLHRLQWLNKRWQWQAGVGAQYHQIQQTTGTRKDSVITPSTLNDFSYSANYFYSGGSNVSHTGTNYRILLSNDFAFALLKHKRSLLLSAGIYTGYNVYNNYLIADYTNYRYVKSGNLYKKWFAGMNLGLEYNFKKGLTAGVTVKRDLTKSYTPVGGEKQYWQSFLFNIGIPLNRK